MPPWRSSSEGGPSALTTVAVAARLGVTQSAIYRHVHNVDELATLASRQIVARLQAQLRTHHRTTRTCRGHKDGDTRNFCDLIVAADGCRTEDVRDDRSVALRRRMRSAPGSATCSTGVERVQRARSWNRMWRTLYGYDKPLTPVAGRHSCAYAGLIQDDVINVARLVRDGRLPGGRDAIARILELRLIARVPWPSCPT